MGNAFAAVADDVYAIHYNPAGLGALERPQLGAAYTKLFMGLSDKSDLGTSFIGYAHPLKEGRYGTLGTAWQSFTLNNIYREDTFYGSYGRLLYTDARGGELNGGLTLKYLRSSFGYFSESDRAISYTGQSGPDPVLSGSSSQGAADVDLGVLYRFAKHYAVGLQATHVNQPNVAFSSGDSDKLPFGVKLGFNYRSLISNLVAQVDTRQSPAGSRDTVAIFAAERWFPQLFVGDFGARGGLSFGSRDFAQLAMGLSYRARRFVLDYGFGFPMKGVSSTAGTHRFALTFRFGRASDEEESLEMVLEALRETRSGAPVRLKAETAGFSPAEKAALEERLAHTRLMEISARYKDALEKLDLALKLAPKDKDLLVHHGRLSDVASRFPRLADYRSDPVQSALHQGLRAYLAGQDELAAGKLASALELKPEDKDIEDFLAYVRKEGALAKPAALPEGKKPASFPIASKLTRAETAIEERRYNEAVELCLDVLREDEENLEAWQDLGTAYFALKDIDASLDAWRKAYELQKSPSLRIAIKGHIRSIERLRVGKETREPKPKPAATESEVPPVRAKLSPQETQALYDKGVASYLKHDIESARRAFETILESDPFNVEAAKALRRIREEKP